MNINKIIVSIGLKRIISWVTTGIFIGIIIPAFFFWHGYESASAGEITIFVLFFGVILSVIVFFFWFIYYISQVKSSTAKEEAPYLLLAIVIRIFIGLIFLALGITDIIFFL